MPVTKWFKVEGVVTKRRARHTRNGHAYTDPKTEAEMQAVGFAYHGPKHPKDVPIRVRVRAYRELAKSTPKRVESQPFTSKPDADNIGKCVLDGLNGVAFADDAQVVDLAVTKLERKRGGGEYTEFAVEPLEGEANGSNAD